MFEQLPGGVYAIRNTLDGKVYVGSAVDLVKRERQHRSKLRHNRHHNDHLQSAWRRDGEASFVFEVLARCASADLLTVEQKHIDRYRAADRRFGYNARPKAESNLGCVWGEATRAKIRKANLGKKQSPEMIERRIAPLRGRRQSPEHTERTRATKLARGIKRPDVALFSRAFARFSPEQVAAIRAARARGGTLRQLADEFGGDPTTIRRVVNFIGPAYAERSA